MTGPIASSTQENEARKVAELIKTLQDTIGDDIEETQVYATSQAAIDYLERQTFLEPENQALLNLQEPPERMLLLPPLKFLGH